MSLRRKQSSLKLSFKSGLCALALATALGCSGRNLHRDLQPDTDILVRKWTLATHGPFEAGDRGSEFSNPVWVENTLVFGNQSQGLISLYPGIQQIRWTLPIKGGVISPVTAEAGTLYFGGGDGFLYSVSSETGRVNWRYDLHNPVISKPTLAEGRLFVTTSDDTVFAFDAATGKWLWHYRRRSSPSATILGASQPWVNGGELLTGLSDGFLVSLSIQDGQLKWERKLHEGSRFTDVDAHPVTDGSAIYVPSYDGALYALKSPRGEVIWRFDAGGSKQVALEGSRVFLPSSNGKVYALNKETSRVLWSFELDKGTPTQLVLTDKYVVVGSSHQYLYVLDKNTGKGLYRFNAGHDSGFYGSLAYDTSAQRLYALSGAGNLYAFALRQPPRKVRPRGATDPYKSVPGIN